jgi:hypothetical protein
VPVDGQALIVGERDDHLTGVGCAELRHIDDHLPWGSAEIREVQAKG